MTLGAWFDRLPTPAKLLLLLSAALLPIGAALVWSAVSGIREAKDALHAAASQEAKAAAGDVEGLIARNALALRIASNAALALPGSDPCAAAQRSLAIAPAVAQRFELEDANGREICTIGEVGELYRPPLVAPGDIRLWISEDGGALMIRTGVMRGSATTSLSVTELRSAIRAGAASTATLDDGRRELAIVAPGPGADDDSTLHREAIGIANGRLVLTIEKPIRDVSLIERLMLLLPLLMWALAALISWLLVHRLLMRPLRRLQRAVGSYQPGDDPAVVLSTGIGPATEIRDLGEAFVRAVARIDEGERQMGVALEGQRRLVREVHHRVKNNLQVVASLLSIHGRSAHGNEAKAAYAAIGRRVDALAVVHRNHFAELEENRGIHLQPMLNELASGLRASAPDGARGIPIELDLDAAATTQDVAVSVAFLITEVVEFAMLAESSGPVEIRLDRTSPLTARLSLGSAALLEEGDGDSERQQFDRIVAGLARQLRSPLDKKLGRYSVDIPIFPER